MDTPKQSSPTPQSDPSEGLKVGGYKVNDLLNIATKPPTPTEPTHLPEKLLPGDSPKSLKQWLVWAGLGVLALGILLVFISFVSGIVFILVGAVIIAFGVLLKPK